MAGLIFDINYSARRGLFCFICYFKLQIKSFIVKLHLTIKVTNKSKNGCKDQESIQSSTTPDPDYHWKSDKLTVRHHKQETRGQPFPSR